MMAVWRNPLDVFRKPEPSEDQYLNDDDYLAQMHQQHERIMYATRWLRDVQNEFSLIKRRVDGDDEPVFMPEERREARRRA